VVFDQLSHAAAQVLAAWAICVGAWLSYEFRCDSRIALVCEELACGRNGAA
jgi:hypothetical protein